MRSKDALANVPETSNDICDVMPVYGTICFQVEGYHQACETSVLRWENIICHFPPAPGGGDGGGGLDPESGGGGGAITPIDLDKSDITNELQDYPCAQALVEKMTTLNNDIAKLIKNTFANNDNVNINFEADLSLIGTNIDGHTSGFASKETGSFTVGINQGVLARSTKELILATLIS